MPRKKPFGNLHESINTILRNQVRLRRSRHLIFSAEPIYGKSVSLASLKGKGSGSEFLVIAGKPSKLEVHSLNEIVETFRDKEVMFLSIAREKKDDLLQYLAANKFEFTTIADPKSVLAADVFSYLGLSNNHCDRPNQQE